MVMIWEKSSHVSKIVVSKKEKGLNKIQENPNGGPGFAGIQVELRSEQQTHSFRHIVCPTSLSVVFSTGNPSFYHVKTFGWK